MCIKLNARSTIADPNIELVHKERTNNITKPQFLDKENKKCPFPTLQFGSFKKTKIGNSTPKSITEELDSFLQEDDISSDLIFTKAISYRSLKRLTKKIMCVPATSTLIEHVFSQSGLLMRANRSSFTENNPCM